MNSSVSVTSNAQSVAQSTVSQLDVKARANQTKAKLKLLLKNVDQGNSHYASLNPLIPIDKQGKVKDQAFFTILELHGLVIS